MSDHHTAQSATTESLTISPGFDFVAESEHAPPQYAVIDRRVLQICGLGILLGLAGGVVAQALLGLIALVTNLAFFGRWSLADAAPQDAVAHLGWFTVVVPVIGALIVGPARVGWVNVSTRQSPGAFGSSGSQNE